MHEDKRKPMKVVGRQGEPKVNVVTFAPMQRAANILRKGRPFVPKGVFRFKSFEEADAWLMKMLTRPWNQDSPK